MGNIILKKNKYNPFVSLNLLIFLAFSIINLTPYLSRNTSLVVSISLLFTWLLTAFLAKPIYFLKMNNLTFSVLLWIGHLIFFQIIGFADSAIGNLLHYIVFWFSIIIFDFYDNILCIKKVRLINKIIMIIMIINILLNIKELIDKPYLSKYITGAYNALEFSLKSNVGNYSFVLLVNCIMIVLFNMFLNAKKTYKLIYLFFSICSFYMIILASSMIGILSSIIIITVYIFCISTKNSFYKKLIFICSAIAIVLIILLFKDYFYIRLNIIVSSMKNTMISVRLANLINAFFGVNEKLSFSGRIELYGYSIKTFLKSFLFGIGRRHTDVEGIIGLHSQILDDFAYFGIYGVILQLNILIRLYKCHFYKYMIVNKGQIKELIFSITCGIVFFALFNPMINMNSGIIIFVFIGLYCRGTLEKFLKERENQHENSFCIK